MQSKLTVLNHIAYTDVGAKQNFSVTPACVCVGRVGSGKTSFVNKVCGVNVETDSFQGYSCAKFVFQRQADFETAFKVLDTPGIASRKDKIILNALNLKSALVDQPINRILLFIRFGRFESILDQIEEQMTIFEDFKEMITLIITHWDQASEETMQKKKQIFTELVEMINEELEISSIICIGKDSPQDQICNAVYKNISQSAQKQIKIDEETFAKKFNLVELREDISKLVDDSTQKFQKIYSQYVELISRFHKEDKDEFLSQIQIDLRVQSEKFIQDIQDQFGLQMIEADSYMHYIELKKRIIPLLQNFNKLARDGMKKKVPSIVKMCPFCQQIWLKFEGCEGTTYCGNRRENIENSLDFFAKFTFCLENGQLDWKRNQQIKVEKEKILYQTVDQNKEVGCGREIIWDQCPSLDQKEIPIQFELESLLFPLNQIQSLENEKQVTNKDLSQIGFKCSQNQVANLEEKKTIHISSQIDNKQNDKQLYQMKTSIKFKKFVGNDGEKFYIIYNLEQNGLIKKKKTQKCNFQGDLNYSDLDLSFLGKLIQIQVFKYNSLSCDSEISQFQIDLIQLKDNKRVNESFDFFYNKKQIKLEYEVCIETKEQELQ